MRKKKIKRLILILIVFTFLFGLVLFFVQSPKSYRFNEKEFTHTKITSTINGTRVAFISDINLKDEKSFERFSKVINEFNEYPVDLVFFGGDLYESHIFKGEELSKLLKSIDCKYGKFAILGEKDIQNEIKITSIFNEGGFEVLQTGIRPLYIQDTSINLIVLDENTDVKKLKLKDKAFTLAISHTPDTFDAIKNKADLQLSGHSYGGLVYIPLIGSMHKDVGCSTYNHGTYYADSSALIVSNGLSGPSSFPYKLGAKNEINIIKLTSQTK